MRLHSLIVDDFLPDFEGWRAWADGCQYGDERNEVDGVSYPLICREVPRWGMQQRLQAVMGAPVDIRALFLRLSPAGVPVPHQAHNDASMGRFSCMVYLNRPEHCRGGTALVRHLTGFDAQPTSEAQAALWRRDMNKPDHWLPYLTCEMRPNRAFIFRADLMHRAEPIGGFGSTPRDARLVMTAFFDS